MTRFNSVSVPCVYGGVHAQNVLRSKQTKKKGELMYCVICKNVINGHGHNPYPIENSGRCCDACNPAVIAARVVHSVSDTPDIDSIAERWMENRRA